MARGSSLEMEHTNFSHNDRRYSLIGNKLHVKLAAYYAIVLGIVLVLISLLLFWIFTTYTLLDFVFLGVFIYIVIVSLLAINANYRESPGLYMPLIIAWWLIITMLFVGLLFTIVMAIFNPQFWQDWMGWLFPFKPDTNKNAASRGMAIIFAIVSLVQLGLITLINSIVTKAWNYSRDKANSMKSGYIQGTTTTATEHYNFSHNDKKYTLLGNKLHVKIAAYHAIVTAIVITLICLLVYWMFRFTLVDWIVFAVASIIFIVSQFAVVGNYRESQSLYIPFIVILWIINLVLMVTVAYTTIMAIANPVYWQDWMNWLFVFKSGTNIEAASRGLTIVFAILSLILLTVFLVINTTAMKARNYTRDKNISMRSGLLIQPVAGGPGSVHVAQRPIISDPLRQEVTACYEERVLQTVVNKDQI